MTKIVRFDTEGNLDIKGEFSEVPDALEFDGESDYVDVGHSDVLEMNVGDAFAMEIWIKPYSKHRSVLVSKYDTDSHTGWWLRFGRGTDDSFIVFGLRQDLSDQILIQTDDEVPLDEWMKITALYDGSGDAAGLSIEINGEEVDYSIDEDDTLTDITGEYPFTIGARDAGASWFFDGKISRLKFYHESSLVGYWPLNEGSGDTVHDKSGNENHGSIVGAEWVYSIEGNRFDTEGNLDIKGEFSEVPDALKLDGENDYVDIPHHDDYGDMSEFTLEMWIKASHQQSMEFFSKYDTEDDASRSFRFYNQNNNNNLRFLGSPDGEDFDSTDITDTELPDGEWCHIAMTFDKGTCRGYINGEHVGTSSVNFDSVYNNSGVNLWLGQSHYMDRYLDGEIRDARIWNTVRSEEEIADNKDKRLSGDEDNLVGYWPMNEGEGTTAIDSAGSNDGTINGATWEESTISYSLSIKETGNTTNTIFSETGPTKGLVGW